MKNKGISLITLVITIVVVIILAAAVILTINNNNPVGNSRVASIVQTRDSLQSGILVYTGKEQAKSLGDYGVNQILISNSTRIVEDDRSTDMFVIKDADIFKLYKLNTDYVESRLNIDLKSSTNAWYIDEKGIVYLVYGTLNDVPSYLKENNNLISSVSSFVVVLDEDDNSSSEPLTARAIVTDNSTGAVTIIGKSLNGIKTISYTGPRTGTSTATSYGNNYMAHAIIGNGTYTFTVTDNEDNSVNVEVVLSSVNSFIIANVDGFCAFRDAVNSGDDFSGITVTQTVDIDLSTVCSSTLGSWSPIGTASKYFSGIYDGENHTISNLYINTDEIRYAALFVGIKNTALLKNIILDEIYINNRYNDSTKDGASAGITVTNKGKIENCGIKSGIISNIKTQNNLSGAGLYSRLAGIAAFNYGEIINCYNKANLYNEISTSAVSYNNIGGIVALSQEGATITNCYNKGTVEAKGYNNLAGGIVGVIYNGTTMTNCYNTNTVTCTGTNNLLGGILGDNQQGSSTITNCYCLQRHNSYGTEVNSTTLQSYASTLGSAYKSDTNNINNGYPILSWE